MNEIKGMKWQKNLKNQFLAVFLHYSADPEKDPDTPSGKAWRDFFRATYAGDDIRWNREMELSFETASGKPVYRPPFDPTVNISDNVQWQPGKLIYRGHDFGYHSPACLWTYENDKDQLIVMREWCPHDILVHEYADEIVSVSKRHYPSAEFMDYCDPAGRQRSDKSERSSVEVLASKGFKVGFRTLGIREGLVIVRKLLTKRPDGLPGLIVHKDCKRLIDALSGGYHYPEVDPEEPYKEQETPYKDGIHDHVCDALRYIATNLRSASMKKKGGRQAPYPEPPPSGRRRPRTGW